MRKMFLTLFFLLFSQAFALPEGYVEAEKDIFFDLNKDIKIEKIILEKDKKVKKFGNFLCMNDCRNYLTLIVSKSKTEMFAVLAVLDNNDNEYFFIYSTKKEKLEKVIHDFGFTKVSIGDTLVVSDSEIHGIISVEDIIFEQTKIDEESKDNSSENLQPIGVQTGQNFCPVFLFLNFFLLFLIK